MDFDINKYREDGLAEAVNKLEELLSHSKAVLLGAGASYCAGLPLTNQLTEKAVESHLLSEESKGILKAIQSYFYGANPASHIEDYLSELVDWLSITSRRSNRGVDSGGVSIDGKIYKNDQLLNSIDEIKKAIAEQVNISVDSGMHERFVRALHRPIRPGKAKHNSSVDYLVMNYDTLIEDALALSGLKYADGIAGGVSGWWDPSTFEASDLDARVYKLHGSINWVEKDGSTAPYRIAPHLKHADTVKSKIMIWPASTKYRETQLDPYAHLMQRARNVLNPKNGEQRVLLIMGYSFGDAHVNLEIQRGLRASNGNLTVIAFTSDNQPMGDLKRWYEDSSINEQVLIFANRGFFHAKDSFELDEDIDWWKFEILTQILEGGV